MTLNEILISLILDKEVSFEQQIKKQVLVDLIITEMKEIELRLGKEKRFSFVHDSQIEFGE